MLYLFLLTALYNMNGGQTSTSLFKSRPCFQLLLYYGGGGEITSKVLSKWEVKKI